MVEELSVDAKQQNEDFRKLQIFSGNWENYRDLIILSTRWSIDGLMIFFSIVHN